MDDFYLVNRQLFNFNKDFQGDDSRHFDNIDDTMTIDLIRKL